MKVNNFPKKGEVILAPLAGYTHSAFRRICRRLGADRTYSELVHAYGLTLRGFEKNKELIYFTKEEIPLHLQLYGRNPAEISQGAAYLLENFKDITAIDINFGCSVKKVLKAKAGSYILKDLNLYYEIIKETNEVAKSFGKFLSIKIRLGFDKDILEKLVETALKAGIKVIAVHPRLAIQGFGGKANWERLKIIKDIFKEDIFLIGSGDIISYDQIDNHFKSYHVDGIMIGRAAIKHPWIFKEYKIKQAIKVSLKEKLELIKLELDMMLEYMSPQKAFRVIKSQVSQILKGEKNKKAIEQPLLKTKSYEEFIDLLNHLTNQPSK